MAEQKIAGLLLTAHAHGARFSSDGVAGPKDLGRAAGLRAGDVVTTGSWGGMHCAAPEDEVIARFPGIGEAAVRISA